jgi:hypothetical protein
LRIAALGGGVGGGCFRGGGGGGQGGARVALSLWSLSLVSPVVGRSPRSLDSEHAHP